MVAAIVLLPLFVSCKTPAVHTTKAPRGTYDAYTHESSERDDAALAQPLQMTTSGTSAFGSKLQNSGNHTLRVYLNNVSKKLIYNIRVASSVSPFTMVYAGRGTICRNYSSISAGRSCQFDITLNAAVAGSHLYVAKFSYQVSGVRGTFIHEIPVTAEVFPATVLGATASLAFGDTTTGTAKTGFISVTHNATTLVATGLTSMVAPANPELTLDDTACKTIARGGSCQIKVDYAPKVAAALPATAVNVSFFDGRQNKVVSVPVTGRGVVPDPGIYANLIFRIHPDLIAGIPEAELRARFERLVRDINKIFAKTTVRRFKLPANGIQPWTEPFISGGGCWPLTEGHDFAVLINKSQLAVSHGGNGGCNLLNDNSIMSLGYNWRAVWSDNDLLTPANAEDYYMRQLRNMVHELGHNHGLALGEYYRACTMDDRTGIPPVINAYCGLGADSPYWKDRLSVTFDPMLGGAASADFMGLAKFSPMSSYIINKSATGEGGFNRCTSYPFCPSILVPNNFDITVEILDRITKAPVQNCQIRLFNLESPPTPNPMQTPVQTGMTGMDGRWSGPWSTGKLVTISPHSSVNAARLAKVQCPGYAPAADWLTSFDLQAGILMPNGGVAGDYRYPGKWLIEVQK